MRRTWTVVVVAGASYNLLVKDTSVLLGLLRGCVNEMNGRQSAAISTQPLLVRQGLWDVALVERGASEFGIGHKLLSAQGVVSAQRIDHH